MKINGDGAAVSVEWQFLAAVGMSRHFDKEERNRVGEPASSGITHKTNRSARSMLPRRHRMLTGPPLNMNRLVEWSACSARRMFQ